MTETFVLPMNEARPWDEENRRLAEALVNCLYWHEDAKKALSKSGLSDADRAWRMAQHIDQIEDIKNALGKRLARIQTEAANMLRREKILEHQAAIVRLESEIVPLETLEQGGGDD